MKYPKRIISVVLMAVMCVTLLHVGTLLSYADTFFEEGDFRFAVLSGDRVAVAKYLGSNKSVALPETVVGRAVTAVYKSCFENADIEEVALPDSYTSIGAFAFSGCVNLVNVQLSENLETIGIMAFSGCSSLETVDFSATNNLSTISFAAFSDCAALKSVSLPDAVTVIGENAFANCVSLQSLTLPAALTAIPEYAFYNCPLMDVYVPETVTFIGENAFAPANAIVAFEGTAAAEYAADSGADNARILRKIMGDVNFDGVVNVNDVTELQRIAAELRPVYAWEKIVADVNGSKDVSIDDATLIQQFLAEYDVAFVS